MVKDYYYYYCHYCRKLIYPFSSALCPRGTIDPRSLAIIFPVSFGIGLYSLSLSLTIFKISPYHGCVFSASALLLVRYRLSLWRIENGIFGTGCCALGGRATHCVEQTPSAPHIGVTGLRTLSLRLLLRFLYTRQIETKGTWVLWIDNMYSDGALGIVGSCIQTLQSIFISTVQMNGVRLNGLDS